mgnify:CR=1 FL=1
MGRVGDGRLLAKLEERGRYVFLSGWGGGVDWNDWGGNWATVLDLITTIGGDADSWIWHELECVASAVETYADSPAGVLDHRFTGILRDRWWVADTEEGPRTLVVDRTTSRNPEHGATVGASGASSHFLTHFQLYGQAVTWPTLEFYDEHENSAVGARAWIGATFGGSTARVVGYAEYASPAQKPGLYTASFQLSVQPARRVRWRFNPMAEDGTPIRKVALLVAGVEVTDPSEAPDDLDLAPYILERTTPVDEVVLYQAKNTHWLRSVSLGPGFGSPGPVTLLDDSTVAAVFSPLINFKIVWDKSAFGLTPSAALWDRYRWVDFDPILVELYDPSVDPFSIHGRVWAEDQTRRRRRFVQAPVHFVPEQGSKSAPIFTASLPASKALNEAFMLERRLPNGSWTPASSMVAAAGVTEKFRYRVVDITTGALIGIRAYRYLRIRIAADRAGAAKIHVGYVASGNPDNLGLKGYLVNLVAGNNDVEIDLCQPALVQGQPVTGEPPVQTANNWRSAGSFRAPLYGLDSVAFEFENNRLTFNGARAVVKNSAWLYQQQTLDWSGAFPADSTDTRFPFYAVVDGMETLRQPQTLTKGFDAWMTEMAKGGLALASFVGSGPNLLEPTLRWSTVNQSTHEGTDGGRLAPINLIAGGEVRASYRGQSVRFSSARAFDTDTVHGSQQWGGVVGASAFPASVMAVQFRIASDPYAQVDAGFSTVLATGWNKLAIPGIRIPRPESVDQPYPPQAELWVPSLSDVIRIRGVWPNQGLAWWFALLGDEGGNGALDSCAVAMGNRAYLIASAPLGRPLTIWRAWMSDMTLSAVATLDTRPGIRDVCLSYQGPHNTVYATWIVDGKVYRARSNNDGTSWGFMTSDGAVFASLGSPFLSLAMPVDFVRETYNSRTYESVVATLSGGSLMGRIYDEDGRLRWSTLITSQAVDDQAFGLWAGQDQTLTIDAIYRVGGVLYRARSNDDGRTWGVTALPVS